MEIITETLDTKSITISLICDALNKMVANGKTEDKINLSLDLNRPEYIMAYNDGTRARCRYFRDNRVIVETLISYDTSSQAKDVECLLKYVDEDINRVKFEKKCYDAYQLDWMISHGHSLNDLYHIQLRYMKEMFDPADFDESEYKDAFSADDLDRSMMQGRDILLYERGFGNGEIFAGKEEFLESEYKDASYMKRLLETMPDSKDMKAKYKEYTGIDVNDIPDIEIHSTAGIIKATDSRRLDEPGMVVSFRPHGTDTDIVLLDTWVVDHPSLDKRPVDLESVTLMPTANGKVSDATEHVHKTLPREYLTGKETYREVIDY